MTQDNNSTEEEGASNEAELGSLHGLIAKTLTDQITNGCTIKNKEGDYEVVPATPAILNVARQFLRDNNISCKADNNADMIALTESLPFNESRPNVN